MDEFDKNNALTVLGIETTCDETAASVVSLDKNGISKLHSNIILFFFILILKKK